ncbi:MAG TPA: NmrA family NAD(P)-binding protein [Streptosporangiaceae bacterium]
MILVTGAGGNAGSAVVRALAAAGEQVRALLRPGSPAAATLPAGVEAASGDLNQPGSLRQPLAGQLRALGPCPRGHPDGRLTGRGVERRRWR